MNDTDLDALVDEVLPLCVRGRDGASFLFDTASLDTTTRFSVPPLLRHLDLTEQLLPPRRFFVNAGGDAPGKLEQRTTSTGELRFDLTLRTELYVSPPAVLATLAHELTHLYLVSNGHQVLRAATGARTPPNSADLTDPEEVRTEVACVALGLGVLRLNGMLDIRERAPDTTLGYLEPAELAAVIARVHDAVGVPAATTAAGLSPAALDLVEAA